MRLGGYKLAVAVVLLFGIFFRIYGLDSKSIWVDEMYSIQISKYSLTTIIGESAKDVHPPLYYILLHFIVRWFGDTEFAVRLLSAIFGSLSILMAFKLGRILFEEKTGFLFSLILAFSAYHVRYSQEARMYSLLILLTITSFYFFVCMLNKKSFVHVAGYILTTSLIAYTHVFGLFIIFVQNIYFVSLCVFSNERYELTFKFWLLVQTVLFITYIPWLKVLITQVMFVGGGALTTLKSPSIYTVRKSFWQFSGSEWLFSIFLVLSLISVFTFKQLKGSLNWRNLFNSIQSYHWQFQLSNIREIYLLGIWLIIPVIFPFLISHIISPVYLTRLTITSSLALYLLAAKGLKNIENRWITYTTLAIVIGLSLMSMVRYYTDFKKKEEWREVAGYLDSNAKEGDLVVFYIDWTQVSFDYYSKRNNLEKFGIGDTDFEYTEQIKKLKDAVNEIDRIWFIVSHQRDKEAAIKDVIAQTHRLVDYKKYHLIKVYFFERSRSLSQNPLFDIPSRFT